jgi:hypothetical protein
MKRRRNSPWSDKTAWASSLGEKKSAAKNPVIKGKRARTGMEAPKAHLAFNMMFQL